MRPQFVSDGLDQRERRDGVGAVDLFERVERVVEEGWLRAGAKDARVVDEGVQAADVACRTTLNVVGDLVAAQVISAGEPADAAPAAPLPPSPEPGSMIERPTP